MELNEYKKIPNQVADGAHKVWLAGLGAFSLVEEEATKLFDQVKQSGKSLESKGKKQFDQLVARGQKLEAKGKKQVDKVRKEAESTVGGWQSEVDARVTAVVQRLGIPARKEIHRLVQRVEELTRKVELTTTGAPERKVYHLTPADNGWAVKLENVDAPLSTHGTKDEALAAARELAQKDEPSQLVVHRLDGTIQTAYTYGGEEGQADA